jgi:Mg-chelatase subunit ChlD
METREKRWRLALGLLDEESELDFSEKEIKIHDALSFLYENDKSKDRKAGYGKSMPKVNRWLGDIREYFPRPVIKILQKDAIERLGIKQILLEPETLEMLEPDAKLAATIISLSKVMPAKSKETARQVVEKVVKAVKEKLQLKLENAVRGALRRNIKKRNPKLSEVNWLRTIEKNLKNYRPEVNALITEQVIGSGRRSGNLKEIVICVDQSGSMSGSVVYAGIFAAVLASLPSLRTRLIYFDTAVADVSEQLSDPVELLFGVQLGGGTDIAKALSYAKTCISRPENSIFILISDLFEGGDRRKMLQTVEEMKRSGVNFIALLALDDDGIPAYDHGTAQALLALDVPVFASTPNEFPDVLARYLKN